MELAYAFSILICANQNYTLNSFLFCENQSTNSKLIITLKQNIPKQSTKQTPSHPQTFPSLPLFLRRECVTLIYTCTFIFHTYSFLNFFLSSPHFLPFFSFPFHLFLFNTNKKQKKSKHNTKNKNKDQKGVPLCQQEHFPLRVPFSENILREKKIPTHATKEKQQQE